MKYQPRFKKLIFLVALYVISQSAIALILGPARAKLANLQFTFDPDRVLQILMGLSTDELARLFRHFYLDFFHPLIYGALLYEALRITRKGRLSVYFLCLPFLASGADVLENLSELFLLTHREQVQPLVAPLAATLSLTKWVSVLGCLLLVLSGWRSKSESGR